MNDFKIELKNQPITQCMHHAGFRAIGKFRVRWKG